MVIKFVSHVRSQTAYYHSFGIARSANSVGGQVVLERKRRRGLGLGPSGPQVVEGWYGQPFPKPLARTREYVDIVRRALAREEPWWPQSS